MHCFLIVSYTLIFMLLPQSIICQKLQWTFRINNVINCNKTGLKLLTDELSTHYRFPKTYIDGRFRVIEDIESLAKILLHIERCNDRGYDCEDFQNWRIHHLCKILTWRNRVWSDFVDHIEPRLRCPFKKETTYEVRNSSVDVDALMNWFPNIFKYRWKIHTKVMDDHDYLAHCCYLEASVHPVRIQNRKIYRNQGNS